MKLSVNQGRICKHELGNPSLHHALRRTNRVKCQCLSHVLLLFAGFGLFLSLPSPLLLSLHNLDLGRFGFPFVLVGLEHLVSIGFLPYYAKVARAP